MTVNIRIIKALMGFHNMSVTDLARVLDQAQSYVGAKLSGGSHGTNKFPKFSKKDVDKLANYFKYNEKVFYLSDVELVFETKNFNCNISI